MDTDTAGRLAEDRNGASDSASSGNDERDIRQAGEAGGESPETDRGISGILDGASRARNRAGGGESDPQYTRPPSLDSVDPEIPKRTRNTQVRSGTTGHKPATVKACGSLMGAIFGGFSLVTTGSYTLQLNAEEKTELGGSLHETLSNFPPSSPVVRFINYVAPWGAMVDGLGKAIWRRLLWLQQRRLNQLRAMQEERSRAQEAQRVDGADEIIAPEPQIFSR